MKNRRWLWVAFLVLALSLFLTSCSGPGTTVTSTPSPSPTTTLPVRNITQGTSYATIQEAIEDAQGGDKIVVSPGTYFERINFQGKNIVVRSENPQNPSTVASTVIDGSGSGSVVTFSGRETQDAVLQGFTIQHGGGTVRIIFTGSSSGGGIYMKNASPTIIDNVIQDDTATSGGGIAITGASSPRIVGNTIQGNTAAFGGGISVESTNSPVIEGNSFNNNQAWHLGGGIFVRFLTAGILDTSGTPWPRNNCPPATEPHNTYSGNTHENGQTTEGCDVYFEQP